MDLWKFTASSNEKKAWAEIELHRLDLCLSIYLLQFRLSVYSSLRNPWSEWDLAMAIDLRNGECQAESLGNPSFSVHPVIYWGAFPLPQIYTNGVWVSDLVDGAR